VNVFSLLKRGLAIGAIAVGFNLGLGAIARPLHAADTIIFTYGSLSRSVTVDDLETFAATGEASNSLEYLIDTIDADPDFVRDILAANLRLNAQTVVEITESLPGEYALFQLGQVLHNAPRVAPIQSLRAAWINSTIDDNRWTVTEFFRAYPTPTLYIDGARLADNVEDTLDFLDEVGDRYEAPLAVMRDILADFVCECGPTTTEVDDAADAETIETSAPSPRTPIDGRTTARVLSGTAARLD